MDRSDRVWKVVYTKPRSEKKIAERLEQRGFEVYCPLQTTLRQWSDRKKKVSVPVFPSYLFLLVNIDESEAVLQDPAVLNYVYWLGKPAIVREKEISDIKDFLSDNEDSSLEIFNYKRGEDVEVVNGPFKGQHGTIDNIRGGRVSLLIESLGMVIRVAIGSDKIIAK